MHGYSREEFIGLGPERYLVPKGERAFLADLETVWPGNPYEVLSVHLRRDSTQFYVEERRSALTLRPITP